MEQAVYRVFVGVLFNLDCRASRLGAERAAVALLSVARSVHYVNKCRHLEVCLIQTSGINQQVIETGISSRKRRMNLPSFVGYARAR